MHRRLFITVNNKRYAVCFSRRTCYYKRRDETFEDIFSTDIWPSWKARCHEGWKKSTERVFAYLLTGSARLLLSTKTLHDQTVVTLACFKRKCCSLVLYLFYSNFDGVVIGQDVYFNYPLSPDHLPNCEHRLTVSRNNSNDNCRIVSWNSWIQKSSNLRNT